MPSVLRLAIGMYGVDAFDLRLKRLAVGYAASVGVYACDGDLRQFRFPELHPAGQSRSDVERVVVARDARAGGGGASAVLEDDALSGGADRSLG